MELAERALDTLRACETTHATVAGRRHFHQTWIRDSSFAAWGHLALGEHERAGSFVSLVESHVTGDGRLPLRFGDPFMAGPALRDLVSGFTRFEARDPRLEPRWGDDKQNTVIVDSNPLFVLTAGLLELCRGTKPTRVRLDAMERAFAYSESRCRFGLIWQEPYADWCDSIKRRGYVTYTNALHYGAARVLALLAPSGERRERYASRAEEIRLLINERLWTRTRYAEWTSETGTMRNYSVESNMLCALLGISSDAQTNLLFTSFDRIPEFTAHVGRRVSPRYPNKLVSKSMTLLSMRHYHDEMQWLWTTGLALLSSRITTPNAEREAALIRAVEHLTRGDAWISEVYLDNERFSNWWYTSEEPFAWSAGMLLAGLIEEPELARAFERIGSR